MQKNDVFPDNFTYPFLLKACSGQFALEQVQMIHAHIEKFGFFTNIFVPNILIDTYSKCGTSGVDTARRLFDAMIERDVVSWNSMIACLIKVGEMGEALRLFEQMPERDIVSWNTVLGGYIKAGELNAAFELFEKMPERNSVSWSTMVSGYSKAGFMNMARMLFDKMPVKNLVHWTIMISGYAEKGLAREAISLYDKMEKAGLQLNSGTYTSILAACAESGLLALGQRVHLSVQRSWLRHDTEVCNALVDMYAKCGNLDKAMDIFDGMVKRDVISWNTMLHGLALHGHGEAALELFSRMRLEGVTPDGVTFIALLCACRDVGLVKDGHHYFSIMEKYYGIVPQVEHYGCIVDLLGRGGYLREAYELIKSMPMEPNAIIWGTLLEACRVHNDGWIAKEVVNQLVKLELSDANAYELLSNLYAATGRWDDAKVKLQMNEEGFGGGDGDGDVIDPSIAMMTDVELLKRAWQNEKEAPEILSFEFNLVKRSKEQIQLMVTSQIPFIALLLLPCIGVSD
ncbi:Pentatricopeptide repeat-containing protein [Thalictrum thalictroides]|uniref:Pentatricopeptide repeat-containing protein n=1 Tax=Thalictrum thalictroides TaxID=46969 RepID=A0A7J6VBV6_THATH|nr:Pentatricopeptide repeat-containing protein [Thalictrum thalictroides]